ncbi:MAG TPA: NAD(P)-binding protein [Candidatus Acidoferrum sp.]|nr:NAD(P)-binding protein [Candidatus Acidoferrum sp.]
MKKIIILGAGLSGLTAAINLAKSGYTVDVYEKNKDVGMRFNGDIQGLENWSDKKDIIQELKDMNLDIDFDYSPFYSILLTNGIGVRETRSKKPLFYLLKRGSFSGTLDFSLKAQALKSGVNIHFQETISPNEANIVATGPIVNEAVGVVKGIIFETDINDTAIIAFNNKLAFKGYSYLLITKKYGCLCTVVRIDDAHRINLYFERTKEFFLEKIGFQIQPIRDVQGFGSFSLKRFTKGNTLYVGEAAGLQDFLLGFGMRFAFASGYLAAQSVIFAKDYTRIVNEHFGQRLRVGIVNKWLWENILSKKDYSLLIKFPNLIKNSYLVHNYTWFQQAMYPLAQFSLKKTYFELKS